MEKLERPQTFKQQVVNDSSSSGGADDKPEERSEHLLLVFDLVTAASSFSGAGTAGWLLPSDLLRLGRTCRDLNHMFGFLPSSLAAVTVNGRKDLLEESKEIVRLPFYLTPVEERRTDILLGRIDTIEKVEEISPISLFRYTNWIQVQFYQLLSEPSTKNLLPLPSIHNLFVARLSYSLKQTILFALGLEEIIKDGLWEGNDLFAKEREAIKSSASLSLPLVTSKKHWSNGPSSRALLHFWKCLLLDLSSHLPSHQLSCLLLSPFQKSYKEDSSITFTTPSLYIASSYFSNFLNPAIPLRFIGPVEEVCIQGSLIQEIPSTIGLWGDSLHTLVIEEHRERITKLPETLGCLSSLSNLHLFQNSISSLPDSLWSLRKLEVLDLSYNCLTEISESIGMLRSLVLLDLNHNKLSFIPASISFCTKLVNLRVNHNPLEEIPVSLSECRKLQVLDCSETLIKEIPDSIIGLPGLRITSRGCRDLVDVGDSEEVVDSLRQQFNAIGNLARVVEVDLTETLSGKDDLRVPTPQSSPPARPKDADALLDALNVLSPTEDKSSLLSSKTRLNAGNLSKKQTSSTSLSSLQQQPSMKARTYDFSFQLWTRPDGVVLSSPTSFLPIEKNLSISIDSSDASNASTQSQSSPIQGAGISKNRTWFYFSFTRNYQNQTKMEWLTIKRLTTTVMPNSSHSKLPRIRSDITNTQNINLKPLTVKLTLMNLNKLQKLCNMGMRPVFRKTYPSGKGKEGCQGYADHEWKRIANIPVTNYTKDGMEMSFTFTFPPLLSHEKEEGSTFLFAYCIPYEFDRLQEKILMVERKLSGQIVDESRSIKERESFLPISQHYKKFFSSTSTTSKSTSNSSSSTSLLQLQEREDLSGIYFHKDVLIKSLDGHSLDIITISSKDSHMQEQEEVTIPGLFPSPLYPKRSKAFTMSPTGKKFVIISGRVHPGETVASFMIDGFLDFIISSDPRAVSLREMFVFKIIPMLNPDGVVRGHYRGDANAVNLNRVYDKPDKELHPTIWGFVTYIKYLVTLGEVGYFLDFHGHANKAGSFLLGNWIVGEEALKKQYEMCRFMHACYLNNVLFDCGECDFSPKGMLPSSKTPEVSEGGTTGKAGGELTKDGTSRVTLYNLTGATHCYTFEANYFGCKLDRRRKELIVSPSDGRAVITPSSSFSSLTKSSSLMTASSSSSHNNLSKSNGTSLNSLSKHGQPGQEKRFTQQDLINMGESIALAIHDTSLPPSPHGGGGGGGRGEKREREWCLDRLKRVYGKARIPLPFGGGGGYEELKARL